MITYEQDSNHYYDIGTKEEILNLLFEKFTYSKKLVWLNIISPLNS